MKHLFFSLLLLLSFSVQSQTTYIKCVSYQNFKASDCQGCGIKEGVFAGLILESSSGIKYALHSPFQVKYSRNNVTITDAYSTVVTRPVASLVMRGAEGRNLNTFLSDCLCNPSTHYVKAITGDFVDLTNPMMPVIDIDSLQVLPAGGTEGQVLKKASSDDFDTEWENAGGGSLGTGFTDGGGTGDVPNATVNVLDTLTFISEGTALLAFDVQETKFSLGVIFNGGTYFNETANFNSYTVFANEITCPGFISSGAGGAIGMRPDVTEDDEKINFVINDSTKLTLDKNGNLGIGTTTPTSALHVVSIPEYTDNSDAISNGLTAGAFYRTGDILKVVH